MTLDDKCRREAILLDANISRSFYFDSINNISLFLAGIPSLVYINHPIKFSFRAIYFGCEFRCPNDERSTISIHTSKAFVRGSDESFVKSRG